MYSRAKKPIPTIKIKERRCTKCGKELPIGAKVYSDRGVKGFRCEICYFK